MSKVKNKKVNFISAYDRDDTPSFLAKNKKLLIVPSVIIVGTIVIASSILISSARLNNQVDKVNSENEEYAKQLANEDYERLANYQATIAKIQGLSAVVDKESKNPELHSLYISSFQEGASLGVTLKTYAYNRENSQLSTTFEATSIGAVDAFVALIRSNKRFSEIEYTGYSAKDNSVSVGESTIQNTSYVFQIKVKIGSGANE